MKKNSPILYVCKKVAGKTAPYGNAILSRFPFQSSETIQTENAVVKHITAKTCVRNVNNLQIVTIDIGSEIWTVLCNHILINDKVAVKSFKVYDVVESDHYPLIVELEER